MEHETGTHTAGPWTVDAWGDDECDVYGPVDQLICSLSQKYCEDTGQGLNQNIERDAALIAAAPDMIAALKGVAAAHAGIESCDMPEWLDAVESAIAKAERSQGAEHED